MWIWKKRLLKNWKNNLYLNFMIKIKNKYKMYKTSSDHYLKFCVKS